MILWAWWEDLYYSDSWDSVPLLAKASWVRFVALSFLVSARWGYAEMWWLSLRARIVESQNILNWEGPVKILESNSWLHAGPPKIRQYDWELSRWFLNFLQAWCHKQELVERDWRASQRVLELLPCLVHVTSTQACCDSLYSSGDSLEEINGEGCSFSCVVRKCHLSWAALCDRRKINEEVNFFMIAVYGFFFLFSLFFFFSF